MNKKDLKLIKTLQELLDKVPAVKTGFSAPTATAGVFIKAYDDYSSVCKFTSTILHHKVEIEEWADVLKKPDADKYEIKPLIELHEEQMKEKLDDFKEFVSARENEGWI